ncbi:tetratricopeptide repeat protein, partial [bacterium]|nr:tetratricopeptide repeat protein [bacterium]
MREQFSEAEEVQSEAIAVRRKLFGNMHPDVARSLNALAVCRSGKGDLPGAKALRL